MQTRHVTLTVIIATSMVTGCGQTEWSWSEGKSLSAQPLRIGDRVVLAQDEFSVKFSVTALEWETGRALWTQPQAGWSRCDQLMGDEGGIFVICGQTVSALDPDTGTVR